MQLLACYHLLSPNAYVSNVDGVYFYLGRLRHAYCNAAAGVLPFIKS